jgi:hypothetical protein
MAKEQTNATDVSVKNISIRSATGSFSLVDNFLELSVFENIFRPCMSASLVLSDSQNIPYKLPIIGEETVDIDIMVKGFEGTKDEKVFSIKPPPFHVNSISNRDFTKPKAQIFTLDLISEQYMSSLHSKVSKSYKNQKISSIVEDIYRTYIDDGTGFLFVEPTDRNETVIIPNLNPFDSIKWLTKRAIQNDSASVNYLFFETIAGTSFMSLDSLAQVEPICTFIQKQRVDDPTGVENISVNIFKIDSFTFLNQFDKSKNIKRGVYSSKLITHDIVRKKIVQSEYNGFNEWFGFNHCGMFPTQSNADVETKSASVNRTSFGPGNSENAFQITNEKALGDMTDSKVEFYPKHYQMYSSNRGDYYDNNVESWKLRRSGHVGVYDGIALLLEISGNSMLRVGHTVTLELPSPQTTDKDDATDDINDKFLSGTYMITAIQHIFSKIKPTEQKVTYNMKIEVVKDGLEDMVETRESRKED